MGTSSNPYDAGSPSQLEIEREAANTGKSVEQVAKELGVTTFTRTTTEKDGVTTTVTKPVGKAPVAPPDKAKPAGKA
jgi:hypothetical protein